MLLRRISIEGGGVGMIAFNRISEFGHTIEHSLFINGLNRIKDFSEYNFINICFYDISYNVEIFNLDKYLKILFVREKIDVNYFLSLSGYEQIKYIAQYVYLALEKVFIRESISLDILNRAYNVMIEDDFYMIWSSNWLKGMHINILSRYEYDRRVVKLEIEKKKQIIFNKILFTIEPIMATPDKDKRKRSLIEPIGLVNDSVFRVNCGIYEYNIDLKTFEIDIIMHEELKNDFFDWETIRNF